MKTIYTIILILLCNLIFAQKIEFVAVAPKKVKVGQRFNIEYKLINANSNVFNAPAFNGFDALNITNFYSSSSSTVYENGKYVTKKETVKTWIVTLSAKKAGTYPIKSASTKAKGKTYNSNNVVINVGKAETATNVSKGNNSDLFVAFTFTKTEAYVGELIVSNAKIFSRYYVGDFADVKFPTFEGFWTHELRAPKNTQFKETSLNNKQYLVAFVQQKMLFPQKTGKLVIEPYSFTCILTDRWGFASERKIATCSPKTIIVKPLPTAGKPNKFSGAVGEFTFKSEINQTNVQVNSAITIKVKVSGNGNFGMFEINEFEIPNSFEILEVKDNNNYKHSASGINGSITYEFSYIPRGPGEFKIPALEFSFFNSKTEKYTTLKTEEYKIIVSGTADSTSNYMAFNNNVEKLGSDIHFIIQDSFKLKTKDNILFGTTKFYLLLIIPLILFLIIVFIRRKQLALRANTDLFNNKQANKISQKRLKLSKKHLTENNKELFFEEITKALWGYLSDKLTIPKSKLTREIAIETLENKGIEKNISDEFIKIINNCEFAKYAPTLENNSLQDTYNDASQIIAKFENVLK